MKYIYNILTRKRKTWNHTVNFKR